MAQDTIQQWNIGLYDRNWMPPETTQPFWTTHFYKTVGDTVINSNNYKKIYFSEDSVFNNLQYFGAVGTHENKIFINKNNNDYLLFDFNLTIDDTAIIIYCIRSAQTILIIPPSNE